MDHFLDRDGGSFAADAATDAPLATISLQSVEGRPTSPHSASLPWSPALSSDEFRDVDTLDMDPERTHTQPLQQSDWDLYNLLYSNPTGDEDNEDILFPLISEPGLDSSSADKTKDVEPQQRLDAQQQVSFGLKCNILVTMSV